MKTMRKEDALQRIRLQFDDVGRRRDVHAECSEEDHYANVEEI